MSAARDGAAWGAMVWQQFGAAITMLERAIAACPPTLWTAPAEPSPFWYLAYHTIFWLDYYVANAPATYAPPSPFGLTELDPAGPLPPEVYSPGELLDYLAHARRQLRAALLDLTAERARAPSRVPSLAMSYGEALLYTLRHVQHHAGQLNLALRGHSVTPPRWVARVGEEGAGSEEPESGAE